MRLPQNAGRLNLRRAVPVLVLASVLAACGGGDGEGEGNEGDAEGVTTAEFCDAYAEVASTTEFEETQQAIADLADLGLPEEASAEAVEGFEILAGIAEDAKDDADATELGSQIDAEGQAKVQEFFTYSTGACEQPAPEDGESGGASEEPTEEPTEEPSEEPTE